MNIMRIVIFMSFVVFLTGCERSQPSAANEPVKNYLNEKTVETPPSNSLIEIKF